MAKYWAFRIAAAIIPLAPMGIARPLASALGVLIWALAPGTRERVERNLRHIPALANDPRRLHFAARGVFQTMALNYLDFFRGAHLSDAELRAGWTIENQDAFDAAMAQGKGMILLSGHFGNFEFAASRLGAIGHKLITPAERMKPERVFELFCQIREHHGLKIVPADSRDSLRELLEALKRNEVVMFVADRYVLGASIETPFFGEPAKLPTGPIALALRSGAPVFTAYSWRTGPKTQHGVFIPLDLSEPETGTDTAPETATASAGTLTATKLERTRTAEHIEHGLRIFLTRLEAVIAAHPEQWVAALAPIWELSDQRDTSASDITRKAGEA